MDTSLKNFLNKLTIENDEINDLINICPGLDIIDVNRAKNNVKSVVDAGFPLIDISSIIYVNPGFLCNNPENTRERILSIDGDIEETLKNDPYLL